MEKQDNVVLLRELLGSKLIAYIASETQTSTVTDWAEGRSEPHGEVYSRLSIALLLARLLSLTEPPSVIQTWMQGSPDSNIPAPARILREGSFEECVELLPEELQEEVW